MEMSTQMIKTSCLPLMHQFNMVSYHDHKLQCSVTIVANEYIHDVQRDSKKLTFGNKIKV